MIAGTHTILYARDADAARAFLRDVLGLEATDAGGGWPIFALPPGEVACHPAETGGHAELYLMCTDIDASRRDLRAKGVETGEPTDEGFGLLTRIDVPGYGSLGLYEPRHPSPLPDFG